MKDVTVGKSSRNDLTEAYIAGFLDGDGAVSAIIERHPEKKFGFRVRVCLDFYQHKDNIGVLHYIRKYFGEGSLGKSIRNTHKLSLRNQETLKMILPLLHKYVIVKKRQIEIALNILSKKVETRKDLLRVAKLADKLSSFNIRSQSIRKNSSKIISQNSPLTTDSRS